jgi:hypothetical protein
MVAVVLRTGARVSCLMLGCYVYVVRCAADL